MADGRVVIEIELKDGSVVKGVANIDKQIQGLDPSARKADSSIKNMVTSLGLVKLATVGFDMLKSSLDAAISRFDTMERFPKIMETLGFSTEESSDSVSRLSDGIDGLPTKLNDVVSTAQRMTAMTGNLNKSTNATLALNNAFLANGASTSDASRGMEQYIQMMGKGEVDMQSWRSVMETMGGSLQYVAEQMGFTGESAQYDLYDALKAGTVTFDEFQNKLIEVGTGTGLLAERAKISSEGIGTSFENLRNTAAKGLANIIKDLDELSIAVTGKNIAKNIDGLKVAVNGAFKGIGTGIQMATPLIKLSADAFSLVFSAGKTLSPVLMGVAAGYATLKVINSINSLMIASNIAFGLAGMSGKALTIVTKAHMVAQVADTGATKADIIAKSAQNGIVSIGTAIMGVFSGAVNIGTVAQTLATAATVSFTTALQLLTGLVGWVVLGVTALVAGASALWKWFKKDSEVTKQLKKDQEELTDATTKLSDESKQNALNRKDDIKTVESSSTAYKKLAESVTELADKEGKSAGEKKLLKDQVEQLNVAYADLNLKYDEETGNLSMSTEALNAKLEAYKQQEKLTSSQEHLLEISKEQAEVDAQLGESAELRERYNEAIGNGGKEAKKAKEGLEELDEQDNILKETQISLQEEFKATEAIVVESSEAVAKAVEESGARQITTYESLEPAQQEAVNKMRESFQSLQESATNAFDKISTDSELSLGQMVENLAHNQEAVRQWGENQAALLAWAGENGYDSFIPFIENIGVDQAGVLSQMAQGLDGSNTEQAALLSELATTYQEGFGTAAEAGKNSMKLGLEGLPEDVKNMVITPVSSLNGEVKAAFQELGKNTTDGAADGINNGKSDVEGAIKDVSKSTQDAFKSDNDINSPSRVYKTFGGFITSGLSSGIDEGKSIVESSIKDISNSMKRAFDNTQQDFQIIGQQAMQGLNNGLIQNAGSVYSTAQGIANRIKTTIQEAMDINSPSRWFKDFIGKNMMVGWADGLKQYSNLPVTAMENAVTLPMLRAESLIGDFPEGMVTHSKTPETSSTNNSYSNSFRGMLDGAVIHIREEADIDKLADKLMSKKEEAQTAKGQRRTIRL